MWIQYAFLNDFSLSGQNVAEIYDDKLQFYEPTFMHKDACKKSKIVLKD
jgi:hypothetical protein